MADWIDAEGFRANVGIVLMRDDGRLFLGGRAGGRGWQFPQGGVRVGEHPEAAVLRELTEETGLSPGDVEVMGVTRGWLRYRLPRQYVRRHSTPLCIGQKQRWFLLRLKSAEASIRFDSSEEPPEFDRARWVDWWEPVRKVVYFKRDVYRRALHELAPLAHGPELPPYPSWWAEAEARRASLSPAAQSPPAAAKAPR